MSCPPTGNEPGLVGYWNFEEGMGNTAYDLSSNGNDGIINGANYSSDVEDHSCQLTSTNGCDSVAVLNLTINHQSDTSITNVTTCDSYDWNGQTYNQSGIFSYDGYVLNDNLSLYFDGNNDYVSLYGLSEHLDGDNITLMGWFSAENVVPNNHQVIFEFRNNDTDQNFGAVLLDNGEIECRYNNTYFYLNTTINSNYWHHLALIYNNGNLSVYFDGLLINSVAVNQITTNTYSEFRIGGSNTYSFDFNGLIDNVSMWNISMTQTNIQQYINCPPTENESGLVGYWNFEQGEGNIAYDLSGNGNDGTINGANYSTNTPEQSCQLTTVNGCDSVAVLNLTINNSNTGVDTQVHCDTHTWIDGVTYTSSNNTVTFTLTNSAGCDSVVTLDLTINNSNTGVDIQEHCDTYTWIDGNTYTESNNTRR